MVSNHHGGGRLVCELVVGGHTGHYGGRGGGRLLCELVVGGQYGQ